jgi:hypothetical protein
MGVLGNLAKRGKRAAGIGFTGYIGKSAGEDLLRKGSREADPIGGAVNTAFMRGDIASAKSAGTKGIGKVGSLAVRALGKRAMGAVAAGSRAGAYAPMAISTAFAVGEIVNTGRLVKEFSGLKKQEREAKEGTAAIKQAMHSKYPLAGTTFEATKADKAEFKANPVVKVGKGQRKDRESVVRGIKVN